jgi:hypothetical protein
MKPKKSISDSIRAAIGLRAYHIWEREGRPEGREHLHWLLAEEEILREQPAEGAPLAPHHSETVMAVPAKKKAVKASATKTPIVKTAKAKPADAKSTNGAAKAVVASVKTKKAVKAKPASRPS